MSRMQGGGFRSHHAFILICFDFPTSAGHLEAKNYCITLSLDVFALNPFDPRLEAEGLSPCVGGGGGGGSQGRDSLNQCRNKLTVETLSRCLLFAVVDVCTRDVLPELTEPM